MREVHGVGGMNREIGKYEISKPGVPVQMRSENFKSDGKGQPGMAAGYQVLKEA